MKYEECRATVTEHNDVLSPREAHLVVDDENTDYFQHPDTAIGKAVFPQDVLTDEVRSQTLLNAKLALCSHNLYGVALKMQYGCYNVSKLEPKMIDLGEVLNSKTLGPLEKLALYKSDEKAFRPDIPGKYVVINEIYLSDDKIDLTVKAASNSK